jgi:hypothetical protein
MYVDSISKIKKFAKRHTPTVVGAIIGVTYIGLESYVFVAISDYLSGTTDYYAIVVVAAVLLFVFFHLFMGIAMAFSSRKIQDKSLLGALFLAYLPSIATMPLAKYISNNKYGEAVSDMLIQGPPITFVFWATLGCLSFGKRTLSYIAALLFWLFVFVPGFAIKPLAAIGYLKAIDFDAFANMMIA